MNALMYWEMTHVLKLYMNVNPTRSIWQKIADCCVTTADRPMYFAVNLITLVHKLMV